MISVYNLAVIFAVIFLIIVIELVRKDKLLEKYSLLWICFSLVLILFSATPAVIEKIASMIDVKYAPSLLFLLGIIYLLAYNLHLTMVVSKQSIKIIRLGQEMALMKEELNKNKG